MCRRVLPHVDDVRKRGRHVIAAGYDYAKRMGRLMAGGALLVIVAALAAGCGENGGPSDATLSAPEGPNHIHGLGINPADDALFIATHSGLFRAAEGSKEVARVDDQFQDTMGFTVVGRDQFLGSGHPAPGEDRPPNLGLIESSDAGQSWQPVSLSGEADFHILRFAHRRVYAYNGLSGTLVLSADLGRTWSERTPPAPVIDLAVDPSDPERLVVSTESGLAVSDDAGRHWRPLAAEIGLLAWPRSGQLLLINASGEVQRASDPEQEWSPIGSIGGQPVAFASGSSDDLYAALPSGVVLESTDGGASWSPRASLQEPRS